MTRPQDEKPADEPVTTTFMISYYVAQRTPLPEAGRMSIAGLCLENIFCLKVRLSLRQRVFFFHGNAKHNL